MLEPEDEPNPPPAFFLAKDDVFVAKDEKLVDFGYDVPETLDPFASTLGPFPTADFIICLMKYIKFSRSSG